MSDTDANKQRIHDLLHVVWDRQDLNALPDFWTEDCVNHAAPAPGNVGLDALRAYHEQFLAVLSAFSGVWNEVTQQVAEGDRVVTHVITRGTHTGPFFGLPPTGRSVVVSAVRIDRLHGGKIAEHWSVSDAAGLLPQLQT